MTTKKNNLGPYLNRVIKALREGGRLVQEDVKIGWTVKYQNGKLMGTISAASIRDLLDGGHVTRKTNNEYVLAGPAADKEAEVTQVFVPGKGMQDVPHDPAPLPVPLVIASALMSRRPELLKLQTFPLDLLEQRAVVGLVGDLIRELEIKDNRIKSLEDQITTAQNVYSELHEIRLNLTEKITQVGYVLRNKPLPDEDDTDE